jgi:hypothetical protein
MNIPDLIPMTWLRQKSDEIVEVHGQSLTVNAHVFAAKGYTRRIRIETKFWDMLSIESGANINTLQVMCMTSTRAQLRRVRDDFWTATFLTTEIGTTGRTALEWLARRNMLNVIEWDELEAKQWLDHHLPALRAAVQKFKTHSTSWSNDEQFTFTDLLGFIQEVEDEHAVRSLTPANFVRLLPLLRYVKRHGYIPKCDELIEKTEKLARIKARENIKLDADES